MPEEHPDRDLLDGPDGGRRRWVIFSRPPPGKCHVVNIYFDPVTGKLVVQYEDEPTK